MKPFRLLKMSLLSVMIFAQNSYAEEFTLKPVVVEASSTHGSQKQRKDSRDAYNSTTSVSTVGGSVLQNLNPTNVSDALRYNVAGLINTPDGGNRFGGGTKIRTQGDFGASQSIDGLPAFKLQGSDAGGFGNNAAIPSIAIDNITILKGGRAVDYGNGTDGGVYETNIKSGRNYKNHQAISIDGSTAREGILQGEIADHNEKWDYYGAVRGFYGDYQGKNGLDQQGLVSGVGKVGYNLSDKTRVEALGIHNKNKAYVYRNNNIEEAPSLVSIGALTLDHAFNDKRAAQVGIQTIQSSSKWAARSRFRETNTNTVFANHFFKTDLSKNIKYDGLVGGEYVYTVNKRDNQWHNEFHDYALKTTNSLIINDKLTLTGGFRYTYFNNDIALNGVQRANNLTEDALLSYQAGAAYQLFEKTKIRTSYSTGYNRFFEKYGNFGTDVLNPDGAQDDIVESRTLEAGINQGIGNGYFDLAIYNTIQDNVPRRNGGALESVELSQTGIELEAFQQLTKKLAASASYMHIFDLEATRADGTKTNGNVFWGSQVVPNPKHQASLRLDYDLSDKVGLWGATYYTTGFESIDANNNITKRKGFTRIDIGGSLKATSKLTLRLRAENLLAERDFGSTVQGNFVNNANTLGRVLWLGADYTF